MCEHIAKVVIVKYGSQEAVLYDLDKRMTLDDIMIDLQKTIGVVSSNLLVKQNISVAFYLSPKVSL